MPDVLKNAKTEPEAAHLRNVLRQLSVILSQGPQPWSQNSLVCFVQSHLTKAIDQRVAQAMKAIKEALKRPRTDGAVVDVLTKENGDLRGEVFDLQVEIHRLKEVASAYSQSCTHEVQKT